MSLDQVEVVTKLLRASRNCNELLLKDCFKDILENGITGKDLNSTDKSGRVSHQNGIDLPMTFSPDIFAINKSTHIPIYLHH